MSIRKEKINPEDDLGFGTQPVIKSQPVINKDGTINIKRTGLPFFTTSNNYHSLITMSWRKFWVIVFSAYFTVNIIFALIYFSLGSDVLDGKSGNTNFDRFMDAFFFSAQTISTVGYGHISPKGIIPNTIAALESMMGLLAFALATGLLYGRFSKPKAYIQFTKHALIGPYKDITGLMFRFVSFKDNHTLTDVEVKVSLSILEEENGKSVYKFYSLPLERTRVDSLPMNFTVVHPIDNESPIQGLTLEDMRNSDFEIYVSLRGYDDGYSSTVLQRTSYTYNEIIFNAKFVQMYKESGDGNTTIVNLNKLNSYNLIEVDTRQIAQVSDTTGDAMKN